eukprot:scaffold1173_cov106-Isochrysis_galbana.AAC.2
MPPKGVWEGPHMVIRFVNDVDVVPFPAPLYIDSPSPSDPCVRVSVVERDPTCIELLQRNLPQARVFAHDITETQPLPAVLVEEIAGGARPVPSQLGLPAIVKGR